MVEVWEGSGEFSEGLVRGGEEGVGGGQVGRVVTQVAEAVRTDRRGSEVYEPLKGEGRGESPPPAFMGIVEALNKVRFHFPPMKC